MIKEHRIIKVERKVEYYKKNNIMVRPKERKMIMGG